MDHISKKVVPVDKASYRTAATVAAQAFSNDPLITTLLPTLPTEVRTQRTINVFIPYYRTCCRLGLPLQVWDGSEITGAACLWPSGTNPLPSWVMASVVLEAFLRNRFRFSGFLGYLKWLSFVEKKHPERPHYYVDFFGVAPLRQNRGLGSALLEFITRKADQEQLGCYLESTNPQNLPLYQRFGFQVIGTGQMVVPTWFLWRDSIR